MNNCVLRVTHIVDRFMEVFPVSILGGMALFISAQVLARYVFKPPLAWSKESIRFMFTWMTFIVGYVGTRKGQHIGVELVQSLFSESIKAGMKVLCDLMSIGFFISVLFYCCAQWDKFSVQTSSALKIPVAFVCLGMMLGCFGMVASYFLHIFEVLKRKRGEEVP